MTRCTICKRESWELSLVDVSQLMDISALNICQGCEKAINNALKLKKFMKYIKDEDLRDKYTALLIKLCKLGTDNYKGEECVRLLEAPAGRRKHHSHSGGLLEHINQMIQIAFVIYGQYTSPFSRILNKGDIVIGCFIHDLHKSYCTFIRDEKSNNALFRYANDNKYMSSEMESLKILIDHGIGLTEDQMNSLFMAEGGWSDLACTRQPLGMSKLAVLVHIADLYSSHVLKK
uniref:HD domain-containing protein n=1 Tax=viral metagenome TaxID=1070528 RepID=A0A6H1ZC97_9ZZZZ